MVSLKGRLIFLCRERSLNAISSARSTAFATIHLCWFGQVATKAMPAKNYMMPCVIILQHLMVQGHLFQAHQVLQNCRRAGQAHGQIMLLPVFTAAVRTNGKTLLHIMNW